MSTQLEQLTDDPILLASFTGNFALQDMLDTYEFTAEVIETFPNQMIYCIHDIHATTISFPIVMDVIKERNLQMRGSYIDEQVQVIFVGRSNQIDIVRDAMIKYGKTMPVFDSVDAAINAINLGLLGKDPQARIEE